MAQPLITLTTEPCGEDMAMVEVAVESTMTLWVLRSTTLIVSPDWVMPEWKRVDGGATTTSASATAVLADQILSKLSRNNFKSLERARTTRLKQDVGIGYCHVKKREKCVFIKFLLFDLQR